MKSDDAIIRDWLARRLKSAGRGAAKRLADFLSIRPEAVSRMVAPAGERRDISAVELARMIAFFNDAPPIALPERGRPSAPQRSRQTATDIPVLSWVSAGALVESGSQIPTEDVPHLSVPDLGGGDWFALRVAGDSMDRLSPEGSTIVVNRRETQLLPGRPYVFVERGETTYKLWEPSPPRLEPHSTNPNNKPIFLDRRRKVGVVGRVRRTFLDL